MRTINTGDIDFEWRLPGKSSSAHASQGPIEWSKLKNHLTRFEVSSNKATAPSVENHRVTCSCKCNSQKEHSHATVLPWISSSESEHEQTKWQRAVLDVDRRKLEHSLSVSFSHFAYLGKQLSNTQSKRCIDEKANTRRQNVTNSRADKFSN